MRFNPALDVERAARAFAERRRVRIADVLEPSSAARLYACLSADVPWRLTYNEGDREVFVDAAALSQIEEREQHERVQAILSQARERFQYLFRSYPMVTAYVRGEDPHLLLHAVLEWLNDPLTLDTFRRITGIASLRKADARATLYRPGHFLTLHDDSGRPEQQRRVAYVLQMTRDWRADFGGHLHFVGADGDIEETLMPRFNSLTLFEVPSPHFVSYVAPYATQPRYAITGWLCDAEDGHASSSGALR